MTVQELIKELEKIEDKTLPIELKLGDRRTLGREVYVKNTSDITSSGLVLRKFVEISGDWYG